MNIELTVFQLCLVLLIFGMTMFLLGWAVALWVKVGPLVESLLHDDRDAGDQEQDTGPDQADS